MEELLLQENRHRDLEPQLDDLEKVEWDNVLDGEKKCEVDLTLKIASLKAMVLEHEHKLDDVRSKETELLSELKEEEEKLAQEKERVKADEDKAREEESKIKEEVSQLQTQCSQVQTELDESETSLSTVDNELKSVETDLKEKQAELTDLEAEMKEENLKDFATHPAPVENPKLLDSGESESRVFVLYVWCFVLTQ